jgi:hypothetical protein
MKKSSSPSSVTLPVTAAQPMSGGSRAGDAADHRVVHGVALQVEAVAKT